MTSGCLTQYVVEDRLHALRWDAGGALANIHDYETARDVGLAGMGQVEGFHKIAPDNVDGMFVLARGWWGVGVGFMEDDYEVALVAGDDARAEYQLLRTQAAFQRATHFGLEMMNAIADGFESAQTDAKTLRRWLESTFYDETYAEELLWVSVPWLSYIASASDQPELVAKLWIPVLILEHSVKLDERVANSVGLTALGAYYSTTDLEKSKRAFDRAIALNAPGYLPPQLAMATAYYCAKRDKRGYAEKLRSIAAAPDEEQQFRFLNLIAKRRAVRYLTAPVMSARCGFDE